MTSLVRRAGLPGRVALPGRVGLALCAILLGACGCAPATEEEAPQATQPPALTDVPDQVYDRIASPPQPSAQVQAFATILEANIAASGGSCAVVYQSLTGAQPASFEVDGDREHTSASMIKLAVLAEVFDRVANGSLALDDTLVLSSGDWAPGSGVVLSMPAGTKLTIEELARYMIAESDNTATNMLIELVGVDAVNQEAANLGLRNTHLRRLMMDEDAADRGIENSVSAQDVALILQSIYQGTFYRADLSALALDYLTKQYDDEGILGGLSTTITFAHKTGMLDNVQNDGGIVLAEKPYILVILIEDMGNENALNLMASITREIDAAQPNF